MSSEDHTLLMLAAKYPGLAVLLRSELQPSARILDLILATAADYPVADALLGADTLLGFDANRVLSEPNAGGTSRISEALSAEVLARAFGAKVLQTECEIRYWPSDGAITDFAIEIDSTSVGVSVTRALGPPNLPYSAEHAETLLRKKLNGVLRSTENACGQWSKQILHVWAPSTAAADAIDKAYGRLDDILTADTVVLVSICEGLAALFEEKSSKVDRAPRPLKGLKSAEHLQALKESEPQARTTCTTTYNMSRERELHARAL